MKRLLVTGSSGIIATAVINGLAGWEITRADRPEVELSHHDTWHKLMPGHDAVLHLAWNHAVLPDHEVHPDNFAMAEHLFRCAKKLGVQRVLYASSVHADDFYAWGDTDGPRPPDLGGSPTGAYGAAKLYGEGLGRLAAAKGLEVVCLRFGGVNVHNTEPTDAYERSVWLRHDDLVAMVERALTREVPASRYMVAHLVSPNPTQLHWVHPFLQ